MNLFVQKSKENPVFNAITVSFCFFSSCIFFLTLTWSIDCCVWKQCKFHKNNMRLLHASCSISNNTQASKMKPSSNKRKEGHRQQEKITALVYAYQCNNSMSDSVSVLVLFWLLREGHTTYEITQVIMVMLGTTSEIVWILKTQTGGGTRFILSSGSVLQLGLCLMSIHWPHGVRFHMCIRSTWINCAFVSILPFIVCCVNLLIHSIFTSPCVWWSLLLCNTVCVTGLNEEPLLPARWHWPVSLSVTGIYTSTC